MKYIWLTTLTVLATYSAVVDAQNDELLEQKKTVSALADTSLSDEQFSQDYKDIDTDKILSKQDQCPNSHRLRGVDNVGCELDADHDGIFDHNDQCPSTPPGYSVNFLGCAADSDNDTVVDEQDRCPMTPLGTPVDAFGCKIDNDQDRDGVVNSKDKCPNTPLGSVVNEHGCVPQATALVDIVFDTGSYQIRPDQLTALDTNLAVLKSLDAGEVVYIAGHTDDVDTAASNLVLSWNRALAVKRYLVNNAGIDSNAIYVDGFGESKPIADNTTETGRQTNRRIEIEVLPVAELPASAKHSAP